jgi:ABC-type glycerol-3-phosphate transport system substrate-binding protein
MKLRFLLLVTTAALVLAACGSDDGADTATASGSSSGSAASTGCKAVDDTDADRDAEVHATLDEWKVAVDKASVDAGVIEFHAENKGNEDHELVIVKGAKPGDLTITEDGLDEEALPDGAEVLGEIEPFNSGDDCAANFDLAAGDYTLLCNIVDEEEKVSHAKEGMVTAFTVR